MEGNGGSLQRACRPGLAAAHFTGLAVSAARPPCSFLGALPAPSLVPPPAGLLFTSPEQPRSATCVQGEPLPHLCPPASRNGGTRPPSQPSQPSQPTSYQLLSPSSTMTGGVARRWGVRHYRPACGNLLPRRQSQSVVPSVVQRPHVAGVVQRPHLVPQAVHQLPALPKGIQVHNILQGQPGEWGTRGQVGWGGLGSGAGASRAAGQH